MLIVRLFYTYISVNWANYTQQCVIFTRLHWTCLQFDINQVVISQLGTVYIKPTLTEFSITL